MKKILIVEDDSLLNKTLAYNLTSDSFHITSVLNFRTAAGMLAETEFDMVLLDINLPDGSGYDLCKLIKPEHPDTIVIFLTANDQESDQLRGYEAGAVDYITKPFSIGALQRKIRTLDGMNLSVEQREFVEIVGISGSGKSALLNIMGGVSIENTDVMDRFSAFRVGI